MQRSHGADIRVLDPDELAARYPGVDFGDVGIGTLGVQHEGWFDAWSLLSEVRRAARRLGVDYVEATASGFRTDGMRVTGVELSNGELLACDFCVLAAGALSGRLAALLDIALPVVPKKRTVFSFKTPF